MQIKQKLNKANSLKLLILWIHDSVFYYLKHPFSFQMFSSFDVIFIHKSTDSCNNEWRNANMYKIKLMISDLTAYTYYPLQRTFNYSLFPHTYIGSVVSTHSYAHMELWILWFQTERNHTIHIKLLPFILSFIMDTLLVHRYNLFAYYISHT